jgi:hypothetical protein
LKYNLIKLSHLKKGKVIVFCVLQATCENTESKLSNQRIVLHNNYYLGDQITEDEGGKCGMHGGKEKYMQGLVEKPEGE